MELILKYAQTIALSIAAIVVAVTVLIAVVKSKNLDLDKIITFFSSLLKGLPPIKHEHTWSEVEKEQIKQICSCVEKIEANTAAQKTNGIKAGFLSVIFLLCFSGCASSQKTDWASFSWCMASSVSKAAIECFNQTQPQERAMLLRAASCTTKPTKK